MKDIFQTCQNEKRTLSRKRMRAFQKKLKKFSQRQKTLLREVVVVKSGLNGNHFWYKQGHSLAHLERGLEPGSNLEK